MTAEDCERIAHVWRRCGFGAAPGAVEAWEERGAEALVDALLANDDYEWYDEAKLAESIGDPEDEEADERLILMAEQWMFDRMVSGANPLHERMSWYWHTHLTSSFERSGGAMMWRQHHLLRRHALGHFPTLMREITTDAAMLLYLDGNESIGTNPNENYARELLELFTLGRNAGYVEDDVKAAARILAGWWVDWETGDVHHEPEYAYSRPVTFMGERRRWTLDDFIAFVCNRPECARHVATRLYHHLVGPDLTEARREELAAVFVDSGLQIKPLVAAILRGPDFLDALHSRARQPLEWLIAARIASGFEEPFTEEEVWWFELLGQIPWLPPNVAGWPLDDRWASASQIIARTSVLLDWELPESTWDEVEPTADAVLRRCGIHVPSDSTLGALKAIESDVTEYDGRLQLLFAATLVSPEFSLL